MVNREDTNNSQQQILQRLNEIESDLSQEISGLKHEVERFNEKFSNYQQATQWVVQLAFTLIASATVTIIVTSILRR